MEGVEDGAVGVAFAGEVPPDEQECAGSQEALVDESSGDVPSGA